MDKVLTEEEMKNRMKEIDEIRASLRDERSVYEDYFDKKRRGKERVSRMDFIGKCFTSLDIKENKYSYVKAFKILDVLYPPNERYAECLAIIDGVRTSAWEEKGVLRMVIPLWTHNVTRLMPKEGDLKIIDYYSEIEEDIFDDMVDEINEKVY